MSSQLTTFSILLGLTDFVNPIFYTFFFLTMLKNLRFESDAFLFKLFKIGAIISLIGGYFIPTGKVIVGLGLLDFVMPVPVVHFVNTGFLISGIALFLMCKRKSSKDISAIIKVLFAIFYIVAFCLTCIFSRYNTAAVLTGVIGIVLIYVSLILMSRKAGKTISMTLAILSFFLTFFLAGVGIKANLYSVTVHWLIELTNIVCQASLFLSAKLLVDNKKAGCNGMTG